MEKNKADTAALYGKIGKLKKAMKSVSKKSNNPFFKSKYADLNSHLDEAEPKAEKLGLVILQPTFSDRESNFVKTQIIDIDTGLAAESILKLPHYDDMQKLGGAITYARRYTLSAALGMKAEDDDGNLAAGVGNKTKKFSKGDF